MSQGVWHCNVWKISSVICFFLQDMYENFCTIILPETKKLINCCEDSITMVIKEFNGLLQVIDFEGLTDLESHLLQQIENIKNDLEVDGSVLKLVSSLRDRYQIVLSGGSGEGTGSTNTLTSGHMLLMAFDGLFVRLHADYTAMMEVHQRSIFQTRWGTVDVMVKSKESQVSGNT